MRKGWLVAALVGATIFGGSVVAYAGDEVHKSLDAVYRSIGIRVDGKLIETPAEPFIVDGRTYVPARPLAEALGAEVGWDGQNVIVKSGVEYKLVSSTDAGDLYAFPRRGGANILLPKGATVGTKANIVLAADTQAGPVLVMRLDSPGVSLENATSVISAVMTALLPEWQEEGHQTTTVQGTAAIDISGHALGNPVRGRVVDDGVNLWAVVGIGGADSVQPIINTFKFTDKQ